ncbi:MAG: SapC family protein [Betaproteobacteria bacterium]|nr:SapC family protein [Betaproteobacteria bacterium]
MQISPPFGYTEVVPLLKTHRVRLLRAGEVPPFARALNAIPISYTEFAPAARDYPIVFTSGDGGKTYAPVAVLGMSTGENLFRAEEDWAKDVYVPAYVRRYPFCMARVRLQDVERRDRLICVEKACVDDSGGEPLFDDQGEPLAKWRNLQRLLVEYEADLERGRELCAILGDYALLQPFSMQATLNAGGQMQLTGMHRVDEAKIEHLNASQFKNLANKGILGRIYAHLLSLENFKRLLQRRAGGTPA